MKDKQESTVYVHEYLPHKNVLTMLVPVLNLILPLCEVRICLKTGAKKLNSEVFGEKNGMYVFYLMINISKMSST